MLDFILEVLLQSFIIISLVGFSICFIITISLLIIEFSDKMKDMNKDQTLIFVEEKLTDFCKNHEIPITYGDEYFIENNKNNSAGVLSYYYKQFPSTTYSDFKIFVRSHDKFSWTVLAHEIGHFISITKYNDDSEYGADYEASKLVRNFLSKKQQNLLKIELSIFFDEDILKDFNHLDFKLKIWKPSKEKETA